MLHTRFNVLLMSFIFRKKTSDSDEKVTAIVDRPKTVFLIFLPIYLCASICLILSLLFFSLYFFILTPSSLPR